MTTYNTNLAAEFWVLSMLHRLGVDAYLTLGNKKAVDIVVAKPNGRILSIDVKGVRKRHDWPADNIRLPANSRQYYAFVTFDGRIADPTHPPSVWIVPARSLQRFIKKFSTRTVVSRALMKSKGQRFVHAWHLITGEQAPST